MDREIVGLKNEVGPQIGGSCAWQLFSRRACSAFVYCFPLFSSPFFLAVSSCGRFAARGNEAAAERCCQVGSWGSGVGDIALKAEKPSAFAPEDHKPALYKQADVARVDSLLLAT